MYNSVIIKLWYLWNIMSLTAIDIRRSIPYEEFDYQNLVGLFGNYRSPRDKISRLIRDGVICRIKKGLYIFGPDYRNEPFSKEVLANLIFGPSYISLGYALSYYGLIPEKIMTLTSVCTGRGRQFHTPVGRFTYIKIPIKAYASGIQQISPDTHQNFLMATHEKALSDFIRLQRGMSTFTINAMTEYLLENIRMDEYELRRMDWVEIRQISKLYRSRSISTLSKVIKRLSVN